MDVHQDSNFLETYQQRIAEIQDISDVIAVANLQLGKLMQKFEWSKQSLQEKSDLVQCPIGHDHKVNQKNLEEHVRICTLRKNGIKSVTKKDLIPLSSAFCYEKTNIVSVNLERSSYVNLGIKVPEGDPKDVTTEEDAENLKRNQHGVEELSVESLVEDREEIIQYQPCDSLDELRFIYSWTKIPPKHFTPDIGSIPYETMKNWLHDNIPDAVDTGNENKHSMVNFVINHVKDMQRPDEMMGRLAPALKAKTRQFVLKIWKFVCAKQLCFKSHIPEHTRNEFDFYGTTLLSTKTDNTEAKKKKKKFDELSLLSNDWTFFQLSTDERLKIYEEVRKIGKVVCQEEAVKFDELKAQAEEQVKVITDFELKDKGEKTHLEVMAELRDYKRRRLSYRGKNKDSRKMSGIEILRELVEQQMMYLKILYQQNQEAAMENKQQHTDDKVINDDFKSESADKVSVTSTEGKVVENKPARFDRQDSREHRTRKERSRSRDRGQNRSRDRSRQRNRERSRSRDSRRRKSRSKSQERHWRRSSRSRERRRNGRSKKTDSKERTRHKETSQREISNVTYYANNET